MNRERQNLIYNPERHPLTASLVGLGNIGSHTALALARLGAGRLELHDPDIIEDHNLSSQAYGVESIGQTKVGAVTGLIRAIDPGIEVAGYVQNYQGSRLTGNYALVCGTDSLESRREIAAIVSKQAVQPGIIIDGRIGGNQLEVHVYASFGEWLAGIPTRSVADPCGGRYISYVSMAIAGFIANTCKRWIRDQGYYKTFILDFDTLATLRGPFVPPSDPNHQ